MPRAAAHLSQSNLPGKIHTLVNQPATGSSMGMPLAVVDIQLAAVASIGPNIVRPDPQNGAAPSRPGSGPAMSETGRHRRGRCRVSFIKRIYANSSENIVEQIQISSAEIPFALPACEAARFAEGSMTSKCGSSCGRTVEPSDQDLHSVAVPMVGTRPAANRARWDGGPTTNMIDPAQGGQSRGSYGG